MPFSRRFQTLVTITLCLALGVVMLGAYTRLTDAGLGCPDWPGCYGHLWVHDGSQVETVKAWTEMLHRYAAGTLGTLIFCIVFLRLRHTPRALGLPILLLVLLVGQALLGMWTVTLKLLPGVVMAHLLGGMAIFTSLALLRLQIACQKPLGLPRFHAALGLGVVILWIQIALGALVSANYAGISCVGFPQCSGQWWPAWHFPSGLSAILPETLTDPAGFLAHPQRVTLQWIHRLGALVTLAYVGTVSALFFKRYRCGLAGFFALGILVLLAVQCLLGIINVTYGLPLPVTVTHNGVAALLSGSLVGLWYLTRTQRSAGGREYGI